MVTIGIAVLLALAQASQLVWATASFGRPEPWPRALGGNLTETLLWALLVPVIFALARRFPLSPQGWRRNLAIHVAAALAVSLTYSALHTGLSDLLPEGVQPFRFARGPRDHPPRVFGPDRPRDLTQPGTPSVSPPDHPPTFRERISPPTFGARVKFLMMRQVSLHFLAYAVILGTWHWLAQQYRLRERERQTQELSRQLSDARLQALRMQLNPHFLFNTLNAIATLVHREPAIADEMISCLSDFLRLTLNSGNTAECPLQHELEFAHRYLDIEKLRFGNRLTLREEIAAECLGVPVPTLVLQPLLENAIRHGIERSEHQGEIRLAARRDGDDLILQVADSGPGLATPAPARSGIGLANTRARLQELHGDRASLRLADRPGGGLDVEIRIPWHGSVGGRSNHAR